MDKKHKRILWLMNHTSLRKFEVPLLIELGYEVFTPKKFPYTQENMSASVDYQFDSSLSIPQEALTVLNKTDFYKRIPSEIDDVMNRFFGICIAAFYPDQLQDYARKFNGVMILRAFGTAASYTEILSSWTGLSLLRGIQKMGGRFYFGQGYENLATREASVFSEHALDMPVGMTNAKVLDRWRGDKNRILFVCPRILASEYYAKVYEDFTTNFDEFDYIIAGAQAILPKDKKVVGFLPDDEFRDAYTNSKVMWYHSTEEYHIHYHPFEAIRWGMPLLFMAGGMLDRLGGKELPGRCTSIKDAKKKIRRIMRGDKRLIHSIRESQGVLLEALSYERCKPVWEQNMRLVEARAQMPVKAPKKRVAIVLNAEYTGGVLDYGIRLLTALEMGRKKHDAQVEFTFVHLEHPNFKEFNHFEKIESLGIPIRSFKYTLFDRSQVIEMIQLQYGRDFPVDSFASSSYYVIDDGINYLNDCDFAIFLSDRSPGLMALQVPYIVCVHDYLQRYIYVYAKNMSLQNALSFARTAEAVLVTTPFTLEDCVHYAGVPREKIALLPYLFDWPEENEQALSVDSEPKDKPYFLWSTNASPHKNHKVVLAALGEYYQNGGTLRCVVTGVNTHLFSPKNKEGAAGNAYVEEIRQIIKVDNGLKKNVTFLGNLSKRTYAAVLRRAVFLLHGGLIDNGNGSVVDAAMLGVPSISSEYPAMKYMDEVLHLHLHFFDPNDSNSLLDRLLEAQEQAPQWKGEVPTHEALDEHTIFHTYEEIYTVIREIIGFRQEKA